MKRKLLKSIRTQKDRQCLLLPIDFSESSSRAARYATDLAARLKASLLLVHVVPVDYGWFNFGKESFSEFDRSLQRQAAKRLQAFVDTNIPRKLSVSLEVRIGQPAEEIVTVAKQARPDLIVLSTHGVTGLDRYLIGSVADRVTRMAPCPVLLVPPHKAASVHKQIQKPILRFSRKPDAKRNSQLVNQFNNESA